MGETETDWPLEDRVECFRHMLPRLAGRAALDAWLADPRTVRLRHKLRHSPEHRELWEEIEGMIGAALAWAAPDGHDGDRAQENHDA